ncbi:TPA: hypothetical protein DEO28_00820 [Candidatus Dependentiae bacterium]|nr:hypothetical protein [Candidatus Dependentiae bacterium]HBZ73042.1 hypothetical protein [Candidatus Dependentiae bacterium]
MKKKPGGNKKNNSFWLVLVLLGIFFSYLIWFNQVNKTMESIDYSEFVEQVDKGNIESVLIKSNHVQGAFKTPVNFKKEGQVKKVTNFDVVVIPSDTLWDKLVDKKVQVKVLSSETSQTAGWVFLFLTLILPLLIFGFFIFFSKRDNQSSGGGKIFNIGKSKARFFYPNEIKIKFKDVAGVEEAKEDLRDIVDFLKEPTKFKKIGAKIPRGILLTGAPGNGKTMLAKAVAGEANCPFFSVSGSDFMEVFVGVGASRVRDLFAQARKHAPCIVFIDEIDAVGRHRGVGIGGGNDEREQTLNQLLSEMDGFATEPGEVIVLAATNRSDILDKALMRPGRFDRKVEVPYPDLVSREQILKIHAKNVKLADDVDFNKIARGTPRFSGADLANLINEAALIASKQNKELIDMNDFEVARDKIMVGAERKSLTRTQEELLMTAYHEAGHALAMILASKFHPLHKVTILSRGGTLGVTWYLPEGDETSHSQLQFISEIKVCLAGRIAEEIIYGVENVTSGAAQDLRVATKIARDMVCLFGMSDLGPVAMVKQDEYGKEYSEGTAQKIDEQVSKIMHENYEKMKKILIDNKNKLDKLAKSLVEKETLMAKDVYEIVEVEMPQDLNKSFARVEGLEC